jgi:putative two-component system hydrogenase maturation factor HypX/HoxX
MKILSLTTAHNSLSQRLSIELSELGYIVEVALAISDSAMLDAVAQHAPDLIIAPMLKRKIPEAIWSKHVCLIVHTGVKGDRGASSLDWAIMTGQRDGPAGGGGNGRGRDLGFAQLCALRALDCQEQRVSPAGH